MPAACFPLFHNQILLEANSANLAVMYLHIQSAEANDTYELPHYRFRVSGSQSEHFKAIETSNCRWRQLIMISDCM